MTVQWVTRKDLGWPALSKNTNTDQGMIAHYDGSRGLLAATVRDGHPACIQYWRRTRSGHMNGNGWRDVGYAYFVCPHRKVFEGRGVDRIQAAELPTSGKRSGGNTRYVAVTFGTGPGELPTEGQIQAWHDLRDWLMSSHNVKPEVYGHRDFTSTDCPGDVIYPLRNTRLKNRPGDSTPAPEAPEGDLDMSKLPMLTVGMEHNAVYTLRALLFERFLSERFDPTKTANDESNEDYLRFWGWLRNRKFDDDLRKDVVDYQKWRFPDTPAEHDGIVGPKTWSQLYQVEE
jgi:hypothetical protein